MTGQDAVNTAKAFSEAVDLSGIILTRIDGDSRGGAALSMKHITSKPIKFLGSGEKVDDFESFHPDRIANRILGNQEEAKKLQDQLMSQKLMTFYKEKMTFKTKKVGF